MDLKRVIVINKKNIIQYTLVKWDAQGTEKKSYYLANVPGPGKSVSLSKSPTYPGNLMFSEKNSMSFS